MDPVDREEEEEEGALCQILSASAPSPPIPPSSPIESQTVQGGTSGRGMLFIEIKLKVLARYKLAILERISHINQCQQKVVLNTLYHLHQVL